MVQHDRRQVCHLRTPRSKPWWLVVITCPRLCVWLPFAPSREAKSAKRKEIEKERKRKETVPTPLPPKRPRTLSTAAMGEDISAMINRAGLFGSLPYEIRQMIYACIFSHKTFRLVHRPSQRQIRCFSSGSVAQDLRPSQLIERELCNTSTTGIIPFLQSCRLIYNEGIHLLYAANTFCFFEENLYTYSYFTPTILPSRLSSITSIDTTVPHQLLFPHDRTRYNHLPPWSQFWKQIARQMIGLRNLKLWLLELYTRTPLALLRIDADWVRPMLALNGLKTLSLELQTGLVSGRVGNGGRNFDLPYVESTWFESDRTTEYLERVTMLQEAMRQRLCA